MKLLRLAIESRRWDLAAHTIILATVSVLKNGSKPPANKIISNSLSRKAGGTKRVTKPRGKRA